MSLGPVLTAQAHLRRVGLFCRRWQPAPVGLLEKEPRDIHNLLVDTVTELERRGYAGSFGQAVVKAVESWSRERIWSAPWKPLDNRKLAIVNKMDEYE